MEQSQPPPPPGWYPDPNDPASQRYWDGNAWTESRAPAAATNGLAVGALVCGIIGSVLGLIPLLYIIALALGLVAFVLGIAGWRRAEKVPSAGRKAMAGWGIALGIVAFGLGIVGAVIVEEAFNDVDEALERSE